MPKSQIEPVALLVAVAAVVLALMSLSGPFAWLASIAGLILLVVLFAYDREGYRSPFQSLAFSAVCGFCVALAAGAVFQLLAARGEVHMADGGWSAKWMPLTCAFATIVIWAIDRVRMGNREPVELRQARRAMRSPEGFIRTASTPSYTTEVSPTPAPPVPVATERIHVEPVHEEPVHAPLRPAPESVFTAPAPEPTAPTVSTLGPESILSQSAPAEPARPHPAPILTRGKTTTIYITLVGEGMNLLRS